MTYLCQACRAGLLWTLRICCGRPPPCPTEALESPLSRALPGLKWRNIYEALSTSHLLLCLQEWMAQHKHCDAHDVIMYLTMLLAKWHLMAFWKTLV